MKGIDAYRLAKRVHARAVTRLVRGGFEAWGTGTVVQPPFESWGEGRVRLGDGVLVGPQTRLFAWAPEGRISIGDRVRLNGMNMIAAAMSIEVGDATAIARGVYVTDHNHARADRAQAIRDQGLADLRPVRIGTGVWIGQNACILRADVGDGAVVAANAVVTKDVPANTVVAGVPARVVGER